MTAVATKTAEKPEIKTTLQATTKPAKKAKQKPGAHHEKRRRMGQRGEDLACDFLVRQGMKILDRNWRCGYGEADIIALDDSTLVFCEVKTRTNEKMGSPIDAITKKKVERYIKLVNVYRSRCTVRHTSLRVDFIGLLVDEQKGRARLHYVRDINASS